MIKELTQEEAARLRDLVRRRFLQSPFNGAGFKISQYKDSYRHLAEDIVRVVPGTEASVTTNRLRKFFYYTDPEVCAPDKLEKPSFGDDFIQVLFKYVQRKRPPLPKWYWRTVALLLLLVIALVAWRRLDRPKYWEEPFTDVSVGGLESREWEILDYDSVAFSKQLRKGCLTAYTYPGGYWVKKDSGEIPMVKNMVVKKIGVKNCVLTSRLVGAFDPNQNWQGAGICIYGPDRSFDNNLIVFFSYAKYPISKDSIRHVQLVHAVLLVNGKPQEKIWPIRLMNTEPHPIKEVEFHLEVRGKEVSIGFRTDAIWRPVSLEKLKFELPFSPTYVGVGASQGHTDAFGKPLGADTVPAFFDYLKVEPLPE